MAKSTVAVRFTGDIAELKRATGDAERELEGFGSRVGPKLKTAMAGAGAAAGAVVVSSFLEAMDREASSARLGAALGLSDDEARQLGKTAGDIYEQGWGESFDAVSGAIESVQSNLGEFIEPEQLEPLTTKAIALADVFRLDVGEAVRTAGFLMQNDLVSSAEEAFDLITVALQRVPAEMRGEVLDAISEYGNSFSGLGFTGEEAIRLILDAADDTSVGVDKVGDAVKEFLIRSTDGSAATTEALQTLKLDAEGIATAIASGGPAAEVAFQQIVDALLTVEDPAARAQLAVALFGTPIEDLAVTKIPDFLTALQNAQTGLNDTEGAADELGDSMDTNAAKVEAFKRKAQTEIVDFFAEQVIPALENLDENWELTWRLIAERGGSATEKVIGYMGDMTQAFEGPIGGALDLLGLLSDIAGVDAGDVAGLVGMDRSEFELLTPEEWERRTTVRGAPLRQRALGGPVMPGEPYIVGENGPEMIVPNSFGDVVPTSQMGGGIVNHFHINGGNHDERSLASTLAWMLAGR